MKKLACMVLAGVSLACSSWAEGVPMDPALLEKPYLFEVVRHLYRWYLDENDVRAAVQSKDFVFWVRSLQPALDEGDNSRYAEVILPQLRASTKVKKADYTVEELGVEAKSDTYKIINVARMEAVPAEPPEGVEIVTVPFAEMIDFLFKTRKDAVFPEGEFLERLRAAARGHLLENGYSKVAPGVQTIHLSPVSPVANELWVFWETGRTLIRFASDIDLANPEVWKHEKLAVKTWNVETQVVVSMDEAPGSNKYLTRDQVGRALYNCVVLGRRMELQPPADVIAQP